MTTALAWPDDMTLGQALELLRGPSWACACIGPYPGSPPGALCPCMAAYAHARVLVRAAHIVVKLLSDAAHT